MTDVSFIDKINFESKRTKVSRTEIETFRKLWMNGLSVTEINELYPMYSRGTIHRYVKGVIRLPARLQKNPFEIFGRSGDSVKTAERVLSIEEAATQKELADIEYWKENHVEGKRWEGPLDNLHISELQEIMKVPTGYHSPMGRIEWYNHYLADSMLGKGNVLSETQHRISHFLDKHDKALIEVFRGAGKTVFVIGGLVYHIVENRDGNFFVQSETIGMSRKRVQAVRTHLMANKQLIADYGFLPHYKDKSGLKQTWKSGEFVVKRDTVQVDPTLIALSWKQAETLGSHFTGGIFDDPWSLKLQRAAPVSVENWLEWYDTTFVPTMDHSEFEHFLCTRKGLEDIYKALEDRGLHAVYKQPAFLQVPTDYHLTRDDSGVIVGVEIPNQDYEISDDCNGRFSAEKFLLIREQMKSQIDTSFEQEYQLNPLPPAGIAFNWDDLRFFNGMHEFLDKVGISGKSFSDPNVAAMRYIKIIGCMDLAFGKSERADYTALVVLGYLHPNVYLLQIFLDRGGNLAKKASMISMAKRQFPKLSEVYVEADLQQTATVDELKGLVTDVAVLPILSRQQETPLRPYKTDEFSPKDIRIMNQLESLLASKSLYINKQMSHFDEFEREFRYFPRSAHKDVLDALGNGISKFKHNKAILYGFSGT